MNRHTGEALSLANRIGQRLALHFAQKRLVVESFKLRRPAALKKKDDSLRLGRMMEPRRRIGFASAKPALAAQQIGESDGSEAGIGQKCSSVHGIWPKKDALDNGLVAASLLACRRQIVRECHFGKLISLPPRPLKVIFSSHTHRDS
jgi:hypothetical protein